MFVNLHYPFPQEYYTGRVHTLTTNLIHYLPLRIGEIVADSKQHSDTTVKRFNVYPISIIGNNLGIISLRAIIKIS